MLWKAAARQECFLAHFYSTTRPSQRLECRLMHACRISDPREWLMRSYKRLSVRLMLWILSDFATFFHQKFCKTNERLCPKCVLVRCNFGNFSKFDARSVTPIYFLDRTIIARSVPDQSHFSAIDVFHFSSLFVFPPSSEKAHKPCSHFISAMRTTTPWAEFSDILEV